MAWYDLLVDNAFVLRFIRFYMFIGIYYIYLDVSIDWSWNAVHLPYTSFNKIVYMSFETLRESSTHSSLAIFVFCLCKLKQWELKKFLFCKSKECNEWVS